MFPPETKNAFCPQPMTRLTEITFNLLRKTPSFWSAQKIWETITPDRQKPEYTVFEVEIVLKHHADYGRLAMAPACDACDPARLKSQRCQHRGFHYVYKMVKTGLAYMAAREGIKKPNEPQ